MSTEKRGCLAVVRVRSVIGAPHQIKKTLEILNLKRTCNCVLLDTRPSYVGMLKKAQAYVTWGEATHETISLLLRKRGKLTGGERLTDENVEKLGYSSIEALADALHSCKVVYASLEGVTPVFALHPPSKGFKGKIKKHVKVGGVAGYRGEDINKLVQSMA